MSIVLRAEDISKVFRLGDVGAKTITEDIRAAWHKITKRQNPYIINASANDREVESNNDFVWALKEINFEVKQGEILGLVGKNGAGKSTLLKILSRTTAPTSGNIKIKGKIASLLEVGTGFHPDLSGRDNIYLNGAILGMKKSEIKSKFDAIVEFAGVQRYIDTPVKRYSSGMYVRLAFAVAAHLEPDILIIDEVLAVGDQEFQNKCLGKMKDVSEQGRTVIFVSHNMGAVNDLCSRAILLNQGIIKLDGPTDKVIKTYVQQNMQVNINENYNIDDATTRRGTGEVRFVGIDTFDVSKNNTNEFFQYDNVSFKLKIKIIHPVKELLASIAFRSGKTRDIVTSTSKIKINTEGISSGDVFTIDIIFPKINLRPGVYETYYWLGSSYADTAFDVVDNLMPPIVIGLHPDTKDIFTSGYFDDNFTFQQNKI
jgi:lipopolysaccharide transport system ATP-binding protein